MNARAPGELSIRHVRAGESARLQEIRLAALAADPEAFAATHAHEAGLGEVWWQSWADQSDDGTEQRTFVLVDASDAWLGLALVRREELRSATASLNAMWVAPEARGRRGALALCAACADWARAQGMRELTLEVVIGNDSALRAYEAAGFAVRDETTWTGHGRTLHEFLMVRPL
jgi:GNAT superfamily N-acetyltransferase